MTSNKIASLVLSFILLTIGMVVMNADADSTVAKVTRKALNLPAVEQTR